MTRSAMEDWEHLEKVRERVSAEVAGKELYLALAEECSELTQACLKMHRAVEGSNPTPVSVEEAAGMVTEELGDVWLCAFMLRIFPDDDLINEKADRWVTRLEENKKKETFE